MQCEVHNKPVEFLCKAETCHYLPLCSLCKSEHMLVQHAPELLPVKKCMIIAQQNLTNQLTVLEELIKPIEDKNSMWAKIEQQKAQLQSQRRKIIQQINRQFQDEIRALQRQNKQLVGEDAEILKGLKQKTQQINQLLKSYQNKSVSLRKSLNYNLDNYLTTLRKIPPMSPSSLTSMNNTHQFYLYPTTKHDFFLSKLQLNAKSLKNRPLKKIMNESPLYFLIDQAHQTTNLLHYFCPADNTLRITPVSSPKWQEYRYIHGQLPSFGTNVHDYYNDRFYWIGGVNSKGQKQDSIIWYDRKRKEWGDAKMQTPRSSAMSILLKPSPRCDSTQILISNGFSNKSLALKSVQIYKPQSKRSQSHSETNFAAASGTLVNFNNNTIFKIGGISKYGNDFAVVQMIQKLQFNKDRTQWQYIQMEDIRKNLTLQEESYRLFYANQAAIQINPNEILIFGGSSHNNTGSAQCYILQIETFTAQNTTGCRYYARWINEKPLISTEDFKELKPIVWGGKVYSLQNITAANGEILQKEKKLIEFDMYEWMETENIVIT